MDTNKGKVILVGAGPGDPELLTIKAYRYLQLADVVLADRLVSPDILKNYIPARTQVIHVGKQCRKGASTPQSRINELLVKYAFEGKLVVRLKGGDVSVFSNIMDELETLVTYGISYEIIPGITAALGAAAFAGIPLTARGYATSMRWLTSHRSDVISNEYWKELARTDDTLVFYMSGETVANVVQKLIQHHIHSEKLLAIIEEATTPNQQVEVYNLYTFEKNYTGKTLASPALLIVGKVVSLHQQFKWLKNTKGQKDYFDPVAARLLTARQDVEALNLLTA